MAILSPRFENEYGPIKSMLVGLKKKKKSCKIEIFFFF